MLAQVIADGTPATVEVAGLLDPPPVDAAEQALVLPLTATNQTVGALVVGVARQLPLSDDYRDFLDLVAAQVSRAVATQRAYEQERPAPPNWPRWIGRRPTSSPTSATSSAPADPRARSAGGHAGRPGAARRRHRAAHHDAPQRVAPAQLVNTVLDFSRLESGRLAARYQPTDLAGYTARLASTFRSATDRAGLRLVVDCPPLPAPVFLDRDMWEKIVLNLVSNAVKFTFDGEIRVRVRAVDGRARLEVTDSGTGIVPDELPHVFERFHRVAGARARTHEGTGIGLALVRELVEMHGGEVGLTSRVDEGSTFTVTIPFGSGHLPVDRVAAFGPLSAGEPEQARLYVAETALWTGVATTPEVDSRPTKGDPAGRILVVDDNVDLREHVTRLLSPSWEVVTASDGLAALPLAREGGFDLVLTDVMMPRLDGFGLVSALRADPRTRHVPIVLLSARAGSAEAVAGLSVGADDYLTKPFTGQELIARVRANVELGQLRGQIIRRLRALADAAVDVNTARSTGDVLQVAAGHALSLAEAARVVVTASDARAEADSGGATATDPSFVYELNGTTGEPLGELRVWRPDGQDAHTDEAALTQMARLVGVRLENAQLYEAEHRIATTLQHSLLPRSMPQLPGAIVAGRYLPGSADVEVGGDWYDAIALEEDELVLVIGDVVGKGVQAAAAMGQLRNALRAYLLEGYDPGESLTRLNRLVGSTERRSFATVVCLLFNPAPAVCGTRARVTRPHC
ncbi:ATP-binding protein [Micromonospora sp. M12]